MKYQTNLLYFVDKFLKYKLPNEVIKKVYEYILMNSNYEYYQCLYNGSCPFIVFKSIENNSPIYVYSNYNLEEKNFHKKDILKLINTLHNIALSIKNIYHIFPEIIEYYEGDKLINIIKRDDEIYFFNKLKKLFISVKFLIIYFYHSYNLNDHTKNIIKEKYYNNFKKEEIEINTTQNKIKKKKVLINKYFSDILKMPKYYEILNILGENINSLIDIINNKDGLIFNSYLIRNKYINSDIYSLKNNLNLFNKNIYNICNLLNDNLVELESPYLDIKINNCEVFLGTNLKNMYTLSSLYNPSPHDFYGYSILLRDKDYKSKCFSYILLGGCDRIIKFKTNEKIIRFYSSFNNNISYIYALSKNYIYFINRKLEVFRIDKFLKFINDFKESLKIPDKIVIDESIFEKYDLNYHIYKYINKFPDEIFYDIIYII